MNKKQEDEYNDRLDCASCAVQLRILEKRRRVAFGSWILTLCRLWRIRLAAKQLIYKRKKRLVDCQIIRTLQICKVAHDYDANNLE